MAAIWLGAAVIGLWSQAFKQYKCANWVHAIAMSGVLVVSIASAALAKYTL